MVMQRVLASLYRVIRWVLPRIIFKGVLNCFAKLRYAVSIGRGSVVDLGCSFSGNNIVMNDTEVSRSSFGKYTYIANNSIIRLCEVGAYCSIGDNVRTCLGLHPMYLFSTHPQTFSERPPSGNAWVTESGFAEHKYVDEAERYVVKIGNDVWVGNNVIIMDGVIIGDGVIIAAGAVVTKNLDAYGVYAGVPAKKIKSRFEQEKINYLLELQWWDKPDQWVIDNIDLMNK